jgi:hypothetical protein
MITKDDFDAIINQYQEIADNYGFDEAYRTFVEVKLIDFEKEEVEQIKHFAKTAEQLIPAEFSGNPKLRYYLAYKYLVVIDLYDICEKELNNA